MTKPLAALLAALALLAGPWAAARDLPARTDGPLVLLPLGQLARHLGEFPTADAGAVTVRTRAGVLTLFEGSADLLWQPRGAPLEQRSLAAPLVRDGDEWWVGADVLPLLGARLLDGAIRLPDGTSLTLAYPDAPPVAEGELVDLGNAVPGLRLYLPGGAGVRAEAVSLLLVDAGLLGLAFPDRRAELDRFIVEAGADRAFYFVVTALEESQWPPVFTFQQGEALIEARHPFRVQVLAGDPERVAPDAPAAGVILLPPDFNPRLPIRVVWGGAAGEIVFRR